MTEKDLENYVESLTQALAKHLDEFIEDCSWYIGKEIDKIHFFLPNELTILPVDQIEPEGSGLIGKEYEVVVRFTKRWEQTKSQKIWRNKSKELLRNLSRLCTDTTPTVISLKDDIENIREDIERKTCFAVSVPQVVKIDPENWLFDAIHDVGLPVALWQRAKIEPDDAWEQIWQEERRWQDIPAYIQQRREEARGNEEQALGHHVGLLWDDHNLTLRRPKLENIPALRKQAS